MMAYVEMNAYDGSGTKQLSNRKKYFNSEGEENMEKIKIIVLCFAFIVCLTGCEKRTDHHDYDATVEKEINVEDAKKEMDEFINNYS